MNKESKKKKWVMSKLIVLVRGKPEERVLANCKLSSGDSGSAVAFWQCGGGYEWCEGCLLMLSS